MNRWYTLSILLFFFPVILHAQPDNWNIRYFSTEDGLSSNHINSIIKDSKGIIWVGTDNGLNWFDGYAFKQLKYASGKDHLLSRIKVLSIYEDGDSMLWVGTSDGLFRFDPSETADRIRQFRYLEPDSQTSTPQPQPVNRICEDRNGLLWMNTGDPDDGIIPVLLNFNKSTETFTQKTLDRVYGETRGDSGNVKEIQDVYADRSGTIWLATNNGLYKYIHGENAFRHYLPFPASGFHRINVLLLLFEDSRDNFWASGVYGLNVFDRERETFGNPLVLHKQVGLYTEQSAVYCISEDQEGYLWMRVNEVLMRILPDTVHEGRMEIISQWMPDARNFTSLNERNAMLAENPHSIWITVANRGLCHISLHRNNFRVIEPAALSLKYAEKINYVTSLFTDPFNDLWFSTTLSGPVRYNMQTGVAKSSRMMPFNMVQEIDVDPDGNLWFATRYGIHHRLETGTRDLEKLITYYPDTARSNSLTQRKEYSMYGKGTLSDYLYEHLIQKDAEGRIWFNSGKGIHDRYIPEMDAFIHLDHRRVDHYNNDTCVAEKEGEIWFPTMRGLKRVIPPFTEAAPYTYIPEHTILYSEMAGDSTSLNSSWIRAIHISTYYEPGNMWIATTGGGLNKMVKKREEGSDAPEIRFEHFTEFDGLCNNSVLGILEDRNGNLWLSTLNGLSKFDPRTSKFVNFFKEDGLPSNQFSWAKPSMGINGDMFFPHPDGVIVFDPESIRSNDEIPGICITNFQINNEEVLPGPHAPLKEDIRYAKEIELNYDQNFLSFEFAALNFEVPERNQYRYRMEGLDRD